MKNNLSLPISLILIVVTICSCKKSENANRSYLTDGVWNFYLRKPDTSRILSFPTTIYSLYHVPPNVGFSSFSSYSIRFNSNGKLTYTTIYPNTDVNWFLQDQNIHVQKNIPNRPTINEIWKIQQLNDTILDVRVRDRSEPENTENYWGYKYYR